MNEMKRKVRAASHPRCKLRGKRNKLLSENNTEFMTFHGDVGTWKQFSAEN